MRRRAGVTNAGPRNRSRSSSSRTRSAGRGMVWLRSTRSTPTGHPLTIRFISFSAQATASLVDVPVTALATMLGRMYSFVMRWILSVPGAGQP